MFEKSGILGCPGQRISGTQVAQATGNIVHCSQKYCPLFSKILSSILKNIVRYPLNIVNFSRKYCPAARNIVNYCQNYYPGSWKFYPLSLKIFPMKLEILYISPQNITQQVEIFLRPLEMLLNFPPRKYISLTTKIL